MYICILLHLVCVTVAECNSGATANVEDAGNHGCEYLTSVWIVLDKAGQNFAAGVIHSKFTCY